MSQTPPKRIFSLDIGTRSIVGIIIEELGDKYRVLDYCIEEHTERSMLDGQIHDVLAVAHVIENVKQQLEHKHGTLTKVAVAAAGRSLQTIRASVTRQISGQPLLTRQDILSFELEAVQTAQQQQALANERLDPTDDFCVGYSVAKYLLDGQTIGSLIDQRGKEITVEVIATFLPRVVIDSMQAALHRSGLEMDALTLEPIAAINVLVPSTMRRLNVALVDIGAGTSDIAITAEGTITAYGMVPFAGDEITDAISQHFVLDFNVAEQLKKQLNDQDSVSFQDVLGLEQTMPTSEVVQAIQPAIRSLAEQIAREIIALNGKSPQAILLIGGGALTPDLGKWLAEIVGLPANRVGIRSLNTHHLTIEADEALQRPELVTPIGIAVAARQHPVKYMTVFVNEQALNLFDLMKLTVRDALLAVGMNIRKMHGKPGLAITITVNGKTKHIPGGHGQPPQINLNGKLVELDEPLSDQDQLHIIKGADGQDAASTVWDIFNKEEEDDMKQIQASKIVVTFNDQLVEMDQGKSYILINGQPASPDDVLQDGDHLEFGYEPVDEIHFLDVFRYVDVDPGQIKKGEMLVMTVNGQPASFNMPIQDGDHLRLYWEPSLKTLSSNTEEEQ